MILLSGDINLYPGLFHNLQPLDPGEWNIFKHSGLHFLHLNVNNLLPKFDELGHIAKLTNASVTGIVKSKLYDSVLTSEIQINEYQLLDHSYNVRSYFPKDIENIFFELLPNTKLIVVGAIYRPPN